MGKNGDLIFELVQFLKEDVKLENLQESTKEAYKNVEKENEAILKENDIMLQNPAFTSRVLPETPEEEKEITSEAILKEWGDLKNDQSFLSQHLDEKAPEGWEGTVKALKKEKDITNPWALVHWMKGKGYKSHVPESKLPADPSQVNAPDTEIQQLAEEKEEKKEEKPKTDVKSANVGVTPEPEKGPIQKTMDQLTPDVDKKSDFKQAAGVADVKDEKKAEVKVTGVVSGTTDESTLPTDPSQVKAPETEIQQLAEEKVLTSLSDETVARDIASKYPGGRVITDPQSKQFIVMVQEKKLKEEKTSEPTKSEIKATDVPMVDAEKPATEDSVPNKDSIKSAEANVSKSDSKDPVVGDKGASTGKQDAPTDQKIDPGSATVANQDAAKVSGGNKTTEQEDPSASTSKATAKVDDKNKDQLTPESKVKENVNVSVQTDDKTVTIDADAGTTTVQTTDTAAIAPMTDVVPVSDTVTPATEEELEDEEVEEMAERILVKEYLEKVGESKWTPKMKTFMDEAKKIKVTENVSLKLKALKEKK